MKKKIIATLSISAMALTMFGGVANAADDVSATTAGKVQFTDEDITDPEKILEMVKPGTNDAIRRAQKDASDTNSTGYGTGSNKINGARFSFIPAFDFGKVALGQTAYSVNAFSPHYLKLDNTDLTIKEDERPVVADDPEKIMPHFVQVQDLGDSKKFTATVKMTPFEETGGGKIKVASINVYNGQKYNNSDSTLSTETALIKDLEKSSGKEGSKFLEINTTNPATVMETADTGYTGASVSSMVFSDPTALYDPAVETKAPTEQELKDAEANKALYPTSYRNKGVRLFIGDTSGLKKDVAYVSTLTWTLTKAK